MNKVAILLASYNGRRWIKEQIDSILTQIDVEVKVFISDDISTDGTREYLNGLYSNEERIVLLKDIGKFGGAAKNFYRLFRDVNFSNFDYISLADQDDIWNKNKLISAIKMCEQNNLDGYSSNTLAFWEDGKELLLDKAQDQTKYDYLFEAAGPGCTYVINIKLATEIKNFLKSKWEEVNKIELHDWLIYAFSRENKYKWQIDKSSGMRYRQHATNQVGANNGLNAKIKRLKLVFSSWYRNESQKIIKILDIETKYSFSKLILNKTYLNNILLLKYTFEFRRKQREKAFLFVLCLLGIY